ncbi:DUF6803 family protein [Phaeospirillum tilakii]|uniref:DUF6803 family protein n=1 Tax=Phaeospirillum tilakii TaxID=741673 RepID=A0ABW5C5Y5_9PROT
MSMTHYMELLATNQPWNLLIFMAIPVVLAETLAITELALLFTGQGDGPLRRINRAAAILAGLVFAAILLYLVPTVVVPLTASGAWRGWIDVVAVGCYLAGAVPLGLVALLDLGLLGRSLSPRRRLGWHVAAVGGFLVVAHVAMIFGMLDPTLGAAPMSHHMSH